MRLNVYIIYDELKDLSPQLDTLRDIDLTLRQIRLPELPDICLQKDCIYLFDASDVKEYAHLLRDIDIISIGPVDLPSIMVAEISLITLPAYCSKAAIFNRVQDIFEKYERWDYSLIRSIAANDSLQQIADQAAAVLANPFALLDITFANILKAGQLPADYKGTAWEFVIEKEYTPVETFHLSSDDLYFFLPYNHKPYIPPGAPYEKYVHLVTNLYLEGKPFGLLATTDINAPLTKGQISLIYHISYSIELAIASSIEFKEAPETVIYYLEKLIKGFPVDDKVLGYHLTKYGWSINDSFRVYTIANPDEKELSDSQAKFCIYRIKKLNDNVIIFSYENFIVMITRRSKKSEENSCHEALISLLTTLGLHCGCSHVFDRFGDLQLYYIQSKVALFEGEKAETKNVLWNFGDYYFPHLINILANLTNLKSLCHPSILRLFEHDKAHDTDLIQCLRIYLFNGCNIAQTGKDLYMHRNTLTYRLQKISEIVEMDLEKLLENERMELWFSCLICLYL